MPYRHKTSIVYRRGERGSGLRVKGEVQDFYKLRDKCLADGILFEDPEFLAEDSSIFFSKTSHKPFQWKRPSEIVSSPRLAIDVASRFNILHGELGNCWILDAMSNLTLHKNLFHNVVPDDQSFLNNYAGIFHFRFWQCGHWIDVVIDDRLPTDNGRLVFLHFSELKEFWSPLLEKAYAKLHGSYEALKEGTTTEALEDFTGGITERYELSRAPPNLHKIMLKAYEHISLMGCSIEGDPDNREAQTPEGLVKGQTYNITMVKYVDIQTPGQTGNTPLIRLRNPWRNKAEWNGAWSAKSQEWRLIPEHRTQKMGLTVDNDGEFWMSFKDFEKHFSNIEICNLNPEFVEDEMLGSDKKRWEMSVFQGEWVKGVSAGGCRNYLETFHHNPQYLIDPDEDDDDEICTVVVALMQKNKRQQRKMGVEVLNIGFALYYLSDPDNLPKPLGLDFFKNNRSVAHSRAFMNIREVSCRFKLPPGVYCIIPSTFRPNEEGEFILRVLSENENNMEENDEELGQAVLQFRTPAAYERDERLEQVETKEVFRNIVGEEDEVGWAELKKLLDISMRHETKGQGFSEDVCRSLVAVMNIDRSGGLCYEEFQVLWKDIVVWTAIFHAYDKDKSGNLDSLELREALNSAGYRLKNTILNILGHRYADRNGMISFEDFIVCAVKLKVMFDIFVQRDPDEDNLVTFTMEEWIEQTVYS